MSLTEYPTPTHLPHVSFDMGVTLTHRGVSYDLYQPAEGGWRVLQDGPGRHDSYGHVITHDTIEDACIHLQRLA